MHTICEKGDFLMCNKKVKKLFVCIVIVAILITALPTPSSIETLAWGSKGEDVKKVQEKLIQYGYLKGEKDGIYLKDTYDAVVLFQKRNGLKADGVVGPSTLSALGISLKSTQNSRDNETYLLARLVHGEARGEPYLGKVAVAAVVLNRVKSAYFPNTISGVVYQQGAFDAVKDGQINLAPDSESIRAAKDALNGWDPTGGCLYYYNPATATSAWIWTRDIQLSIGEHNFAI